MPLAGYGSSSEGASRDPVLCWGRTEKASRRHRRYAATLLSRGQAALSPHAPPSVHPLTTCVLSVWGTRRDGIRPKVAAVVHSRAEANVGHFPHSGVNKACLNKCRAFPTHARQKKKKGQGGVTPHIRTPSLAILIELLVSLPLPVSCLLLDSLGLHATHTPPGRLGGSRPLKVYRSEIEIHDERRRRLWVAPPT